MYAVTRSSSQKIMETRMYYILNDRFRISGAKRVILWLSPLQTPSCEKHTALLTRPKHILAVQSSESVAITYYRDCVGGTFFLHTAACQLYGRSTPLLLVTDCRDCTTNGFFFPSPGDPPVRSCAAQCSATTVCGTVEVPPEHLKVGGT